MINQNCNIIVLIFICIVIIIVIFMVIVLGVNGNRGSVTSVIYPFPCLPCSPPQVQWAQGGVLCTAPCQMRVYTGVSGCRLWEIQFWSRLWPARCCSAALPFHVHRPPVAPHCADLPTKWASKCMVRKPVMIGSECCYRLAHSIDMSWNC